MKKTFVYFSLTLLLFSCAENKEKSKDITNNKLEISKKDFTSTHVFEATLDTIAFHRCMGLTSLCPEECGSSGMLATFNVTDYKEFIVNGEAGTEKIETYRVLISDFYEKDLDEAYVPIIKELNKGDKVLFYIDFVYDTTKSVISPVENIISITPL